MFVHKSKPLALSFACAAMAMGLAASPAQADRQQGDYCSAPDVCNQRQIGIIQKERDGVNYFYGGSDVPPPQVNYIYLRDDTVEPVNISNVNTTNFAAPQYTHLFRTKNDHWKKKSHWKWKKLHPGPLDLPGLSGGIYKGP